MSTRKNRPVLYEVVNRARRPRDPQPARLNSSSSAAELLDYADLTTNGAPEPAVAPRSLMANAGLERPRGARWRDGKLQLLLGWPDFTVIAVMTIFVLYIVFQAGIRVGVSSAAGPAADNAAPRLPENPETARGVAKDPQRSAAGEPTRGSELPPVRVQRPGNVAVPPKRPDESAARNPSETDAAPPQPAPEAQPSAETSAVRPATTLVKGLTYVRIQHFRSSKRDEADKAAEFLRGQGIACEVVDVGKEPVLIAAEPFDLNRKPKDPELAKEKERLKLFKKRISDLGREYNMKTGYSFDKAYESQW